MGEGISPAVRSKKHTRLKKYVNRKWRFIFAMTLMMFCSAPVGAMDDSHGDHMNILVKNDGANHEDMAGASLNANRHGGEPTDAETRGSLEADGPGENSDVAKTIIIDDAIHEDMGGTSLNANRHGGEPADDITMENRDNDGDTFRTDEYDNSSETMTQPAGSKESEGTWARWRHCEGQRALWPKGRHDKLYDMVNCKGISHENYGTPCVPAGTQVMARGCCGSYKMG